MSRSASKTFDTQGLGVARSKSNEHTVAIDTHEGKSNLGSSAPPKR